MGEVEQKLAIDMRNITKTFGTAVANNKVNLQVKYGEVLSLLGENGSGKTTLLELLAGIRPIPAAAKIICKTTMTILPQLKERLSKSGGETTQAYILQALKQQSGLLLADEPTNHLDLDAVTALEELLCNYPGTLIFTTHDRRLLKAIAKNLLVFDGTKLNFFPGPYDDYSNKQIYTEYTLSLIHI